MILLDPPREALREAIATRFDAMLAAGAMEEVRALLAWGWTDDSAAAARAWGAGTGRGAAGRDQPGGRHGSAPFWRRTNIPSAR